MANTYIQDILRGVEARLVSELPHAVTVTSTIKGSETFAEAMVRPPAVVIVLEGASAFEPGRPMGDARKTEQFTLGLAVFASVDLHLPTGEDLSSLLPMIRKALTPQTGFKPEAACSLLAWQGWSVEEVIPGGLVVRDEYTFTRSPQATD